MNLAQLEIKRKDLYYIIITVIILGAVIVLGYQQIAPAQGGQQGVSVEVVQPVGDSFNRQAVERMRDEERIKNFIAPLDVTTDTGTPAPFGQL